jgi:hypothetical protein
MAANYTSPDAISQFWNQSKIDSTNAINSQYQPQIADTQTQMDNLPKEYDPLRSAAVVNNALETKRIDEKMAGTGNTNSGTNLTYQTAQSGAYQGQMGGINLKQEADKQNYISRMNTLKGNQAAAISNSNSTIGQAQAKEINNYNIAQVKANTPSVSSVTAANNKIATDNYNSVVDSIKNGAVTYVDTPNLNAQGQTIQKQVIDPIQANAIINEQLNNGYISPADAQRLRVSYNITNNTLNQAQTKVDKSNTDAQAKAVQVAQTKSDATWKEVSRVRNNGADNKAHGAAMQSTLNNAYGTDFSKMSISDLINYKDISDYYSKNQNGGNYLKLIDNKTLATALAHSNLSDTNVAKYIKQYNL